MSHTNAATEPESVAEMVANALGGNSRMRKRQVRPCLQRVHYSCAECHRRKHKVRLLLTVRPQDTMQLVCRPWYW